MRFISPSGNFRLTVIHDKTDASDGFTRTVKPGYVAEFKMGLLDGYERQVAREQLVFPGGVTDRQNIDGSPFDYIQMAGVFDTEWVDDPETRREVERRMLTEEMGCGKGDAYVLVQQPKLAAPWPSYDELVIHGRRNAEHVAEKNLEIAAATGVPVEDLIAYEKQERNDSRIVAAYEQALTSSPEPEEELVRA